VLVQSLEPTVCGDEQRPRKKGGQPGTFAAVRSAKSVQAFYQLHKSYNVPAEEERPRTKFIANHDNLTGARTPQNVRANIIKMSVAPDGKSYNRFSGAIDGGHSKTYKTKGDGRPRRPAVGVAGCWRRHYRKSGSLEIALVRGD
jgi:hypothetical protein